MTNGELKTLIRTILKEELSKLQEAPVADTKPGSQRFTITHPWDAESAASDIYESDEFTEAFADDGWAFGDRVYDLVERKVSEKFGNQSATVHDKTVAKVISHLRRFAKKQDKDSDFFDWAADETVAKIYRDSHDEYGNEY